MPSAIISEGGLPKNSVLATCILFSVRVPVLSVHITVVAPIVSHACILRTRLLVLSILRIEYASDRVTAMGSPSGTDTTTSVTAIMNVCRQYVRNGIRSCMPPWLPR